MDEVISENPMEMKRVKSVSCSEGDAIHQDIIQEYVSVMDQSSDTLIRDYELSLTETEEIMKNIQDKMREIGFICEEGHIVNQSIGKIYSERGEKSLRDSDKRDYTLKVLLKRKSYYDYVSVETQIAKLGALMQNVLILKYWDIRYINFLRKKLKNNLSKVCDSYLKPYFSGYVIQDILCNPIGLGFNTEKMDELVALLNKNVVSFNKGVETCSVLKIFIDRDNNLTPSDYNLYLGEIDHDMFPDLLEKYNLWYAQENPEVIVSDTRASISLMTKRMVLKKEWFTIKISQKNNKWMLGIFCRNTINPYLIMKTLYNKTKMTNIYHKCNFTIYGIYKEFSRVGSGTRGLFREEGVQGVKTCDTCGGSLYYDCINQKVLDTCPTCYILKIMGAYLKKK